MLVRWLEKVPKNIPNQMVVKNGDKSHGNPKDHLQQTQAKISRILCAFQVFHGFVHVFCCVGEDLKSVDGRNPKQPPGI